MVSLHQYSNLCLMPRYSSPALASTIAHNDGFSLLQQSLVKSNGCRGSVGKWRRPRPIKRHTSTRSAGDWGPRRFSLALWLHLEAKSERALGPGATVGVLGTGVPDLPACGPRRGSTSGPVLPIFTSKHSRPPRGAKPREADDTKTSLRGGLTRLAPKERRYQCKVHLARFT